MVDTVPLCLLSGRHEVDKGSMHSIQDLHAGLAGEQIIHLLDISCKCTVYTSCHSTTAGVVITSQSLLLPICCLTPGIVPSSS